MPVAGAGADGIPRLSPVRPAGEDMDTRACGGQWPIGKFGRSRAARCPAAVPHLYNLEEERGSVSDWLGEDLEQHALFVSVGQDAKLGALGQLGLAQRIRPQPLRQRGVVEVAGPVHEFKAAARAAHRTDSGDDVGSLERHVLNSGATMLVEVRLDLRLALASGGRLVDGEQHGFVVRGEHHRVEPRVNRADVLRGELCKLVESGDGL
mmetsp:Transcript_15646/g.49737  ORF Transcript_15646/g.49737 Transcript_15646/m.49737 type:complete len:208 (+) Transcript_15646:89-712(+)